MIPHLEGDEHALMALGLLHSLIEADVRQTEEIPPPSRWLDLWTFAVERTRDNAKMSAEGLMAKGRNLTLAEEAQAALGAQAQRVVRAPGVEAGGRQPDAHQVVTVCDPL